MWENIAEPGRPQMIIWLMSTAIWILKSTNAHSEFVISSTFPLQHWLNEGASKVRYAYIVCLVLNSMTVVIAVSILKLYSL